MVFNMDRILAALSIAMLASSVLVSGQEVAGPESPRMVFAQRHKKQDTVTQIVTTTVSPQALAAATPQNVTLTGTVTQQLTTTVTPQSLAAATPLALNSSAPAQPQLATSPLPTPAPAAAAATSPAAEVPNGLLTLTVALQQAVLMRLGSGEGPPGVVTIGRGGGITMPEAQATQAPGGGMVAPEAQAAQAAAAVPISQAAGAVAGQQMKAPQDGGGAGAGAGGQEAGAGRAAVGGEAVMAVRDPAAGGFPGGTPVAGVDLPLTVIFLVMFAVGAYTHITLFRNNGKRGHKFLLSDLVFDFCMVRTLTCIFRIIWTFVAPRGVILAAQIFENGGAAVIFAIQIFLAQRVVRSMHPRVGWSVPFSLGTRILAISVPVVIVINIISLIVSFFSIGNDARLSTAEGFLKFGASWNIMLVTVPFAIVSVACAVPGPRPERFGVGHLRVKTSLVMLVAALLAAGATVRTFAIFNPQPVDTDQVLFGKPVFYLTGFLMEITVVALYAFLRIDLLFHVPNGSSQPGDYSAASRAGRDEKGSWLSREEIEEVISQSGVPHQILKPSYSKYNMGQRSSSGTEAVIALFYPGTEGGANASGADMQTETTQGVLPPRPNNRVSRRASVMDALGYGQQTPRRRQSTVDPNGGLPSRPGPLQPGNSGESYQNFNARPIEEEYNEAFRRGQETGEIRIGTEFV